MHPRTFPPLVEAFLIVDQPRQRLSHWANELSPLDDGRAPPLATVSAYYDPACDQALLGLRYDELALGGDRLAFVIEIALLAEIGMIQPAELSEGDRKRFLGERLSRCTMHVGDQRSVVGALTELVRRVREGKLVPKSALVEATQPSRSTPKQMPVRPTPPPIPANAAARGTTKPRGEDTPAPVNAKGTRDDLQHAKPPAMPRAISPNVVSRPVGYGSNSSIKRLSSEPEPEPQSSATPPGIIYARYLRSGRWVPVRIGSLSLKGAALMAGALPRIGDYADIALSYSDHRALVRGPVRKLSTPEETAMTGTATFTVVFELDDTAHRQLTTLLTAARAAQITIKPPPARSTRRFPVEWPVCLGTMRGAIRGEALDISREGMFVKPMHSLSLDAMLNFSVVLDDGASPVSGRAKVVRHVHASDAKLSGLVPGYGLNITDMQPLDRERWNDFVARIAKRAEKRILIGAAPERLRELQAAFVALGYAVTGGTDPGALVQLAGAANPVDAVLLDASWLAPSASAEWIESLFSARNVPCVTMHGDARRGRAEIDKILTVV